jgi:methyl-accepting chemotaxis protein
MNTTTVTAPSQSATATGLRNLADQPRLARVADQLRALADAVDPNKKTDVHSWAGVDLFAAFLNEDTVGPPRHVWRGRILDIWVQTLFFAPIFVTWLALTEATRAYRQSLKVRVSSTESFLAGWQTGFDGHLPSAFYLDKVAFGVVLLIAILVISMIAQSVYRGRVDEDEPAKLYQELARWLTAAQLELAPVRLSSPTHIAEELHDATNEFAKTATKIREVGDIAERTQTEASAGLTAVSTALAGVKDLAQAAQEASKNVDKSSQAMEQRLTEMKSTTSAIVDAETSLVQQIGQHSTNLSSSATGLSASVKDAIESSQKQMSATVDSSSAKIVTALDTGADQIRSALAEITVAGGQYTHQVEQAADVLGLASDAVNKLPESVAELQRRVIETVAKLQQQVTEMGKRIDDLGGAIDRAREVMPTPADIPADLQAALQDLSAAATALQSASVAIREGSQPWPPPRRGFFERLIRP